MIRNARFAKSPECPTNEQLLAYGRRILGPAAARQVAAHLPDCEFCSLLLDLLQSHPEGDPPPPDPPPLPERLRRLFPRRH